MRTIIFVRHAKVDMDSSIAIPAEKLKQWESEYNDAPIIKVLPDQGLIESIRSADYVISSTLRRSIESLELLEIDIDEKNALFNEAVIPALKGKKINMRPVNWLILFRLLSLMGIGRWARTLKRTKLDARMAASRLHDLSFEHEKIVLMGHGVMNWLIRQALIKSGWTGQGSDKHSNWGSTVLTYDRGNKI